MNGFGLRPKDSWVGKISNVMDSCLIVWKTKEDKVRCVEAQGKDEAKEIASRVGEGIIFKDEKMYLFGKEENGEIKVYQLKA